MKFHHTKLWKLKKQYNFNMMESSGHHYPITKTHKDRIHWIGDNLILGGDGENWYVWDKETLDTTTLTIPDILSIPPTYTFNTDEELIALILLQE